MTSQAAQSCCRRRHHLPHLLVEAQAQPLLLHLRPVELQVRHPLLQLLLVSCNSAHWFCAYNPSLQILPIRRCMMQVTAATMPFTKFLVPVHAAACSAVDVSWASCAHSPHCRVSLLQAAILSAKPSFSCLLLCCLLALCLWLHVFDHKLTHHFKCQNVL